MSNVIDESRLLFLKIEKYVYDKHHVFDTSGCPRPHFCMGLVTDGSGIFHDCERNADIAIEEGDIIFVPITSRYVSEWKAEGRISYISAHFIFDDGSCFSNGKKFLLQKVRTRDPEKTLAIFEYMLKYAEAEGFERLGVLSGFYGVLSEIFPSLSYENEEVFDERIKKALCYVRENYASELTVSTLARAANMSVSRFFPAFKRSTGTTPVEYVNSYRVSRAIVLLISDEGSGRSIEEISEMVGFESSAYFRRVFKKLTLKNPRDYKKTSMEI